MHGEHHATLHGEHHATWHMEREAIEHLLVQEAMEHLKLWCTRSNRVPQAISFLQAFKHLKLAPNCSSLRGKMRKGHVERRAPPRCGTQVGGVANQLRERHLVRVRVRVCVCLR